MKKYGGKMSQIKSNLSKEFLILVELEEHIRSAIDCYKRDIEWLTRRQLEPSNNSIAELAYNKLIYTCEVRIEELSWVLAKLNLKIKTLEDNNE